MGIENELHQAAAITELQQALNRAQKATKRHKMRTDEMIAAVYQAAKDASLGTPHVVMGPAKDIRKGHTEVALLHSTDWQIGKHTPDFNMEIAQQRLELMYEKVAAITALHRAAMPVKECHLMLGGDMVEGVSIFPGQVWEIEAHLFEQLFFTADLIVSLVNALLGEFEKVVIWEEAGNHGRLGRKGENPAGDNIDRMAYKIAKQRIGTNKRLTWHTMDSWHQIVEIGKYRALLVHGDEVASFGGIVRKVQQWQSGVVEPFMDCYMGHFHRPDTYTLASGGSVYITGSIESSNEYAIRTMAATGKPSQRLHFVDPTKGRVTAEYRLWLD